MASRNIIRNWGILVVLFLGIIYSLMVTGKEHSIILDNRNGLSGLRYSIDGENYQAMGTKKIQRYVQGKAHTIYIKKSNGQVTEKDFQLGFQENDLELDIKEIVKS